MHLGYQVELKDQPSITGFIKKEYLRHHVVHPLYHALNSKHVDAQVKAGWIFAVRVRVLFAEHTLRADFGVEEHSLHIAGGFPALNAGV